MITTLGILKAIPSQDELLDYTNALLTINNYVYAITTQTMPNLNNPPERYSDFINQFENAQNDPCKWTQTYFGIMVSTANTILSNSNPFADIENDLNKLIINPNDQGARSVLKSDFVDLQNTFNTENNTIQPVYNFINEFQSTISSNANTLENLSNEALNEANQDKDKILQLNSKINDLQNEIAKNKHYLSMIELAGKGANMLIEIATGDLSKIESKLVDTIFNMSNFGTDKSIAGKLVTGEIQQLQDDITSIYDSIASFNQDIAVLNVLSNQFTQLSSSSDENKLALSKILNMWTNLSTAVENVVNELGTEEWNNLKAQDYQQALNDIQSMKENWNTLYGSAQLLSTVTFNWQDKNNNWFQYGINNPTPNNVKLNKIQVS
jgi:hypothetical protein